MTGMQCSIQGTVSLGEESKYKVNLTDKLHHNNYKNVAVI